MGICTIADLIAFRMRNESFVHRAAETVIPTAHAGEFRIVVYENEMEHYQHIALVKGDIPAGADPLVRVHIQDTLGDTLGVEAPLLGWPVSAAIERIAREESGILILHRANETSQALMEAVNRLGESADEVGEQRSGDAVLRTYGVGAQILKDLGVRRMRVLSAPKQMYAISGFDLEISEYVVD